jgi:hypothetical protein
VKAHHFFGLSVVLAGCGFKAATTIDSSSIDGNIVDAPIIDAMIDSRMIDSLVPPTDFLVDHVGTVPLSLLSQDRNFTTDTTIDTTSTTGTVPLTFVPQTGGSLVAVLYARNLAVNSTVRIIGDKPLVIVAETITINTTGVLDASARHEIPGANGHNFAEPGSGAGGKGNGGGFRVRTSGAGGAGHGTAGATGGSSNTTDAPRGTAGVATGDQKITVLTGGSAGGNSRCPVNSTTPSNSGVGGAGGGAIQLSARLTLIINGKIVAGGGGGAGGRNCNNPTNGDLDSGGGGGSGGAIYIQTLQLVLNVGSGVYANGGGGGGGSVFSSGVKPGGAGSDGDSGAQSDGGGGGNGDATRTGGKGGSSAAGPATGGDGNYGGGGGGAVGRIAVHGTVPSAALPSFSPAPFIITP